MSKRLRLKLAAVSEQAIKALIQDIKKDEQELSETMDWLTKNSFRGDFSRLDADIDAYFNALEDADADFESLDKKVRLLRSDIKDAVFADDNDTGYTRGKYMELCNNFHDKRTAPTFKSFVVEAAIRLIWVAVQDLHRYIKEHDNVPFGMVFGYQKEYEDHTNRLIAYSKVLPTSSSKASDLFDQVLINNTEDAYMETYDEAGHGEFEEGF